MSLDYLLLVHQHLIARCKSPFPDENVHDLRRLRSRVAHLIAFWPSSVPTLQ